MCWHHLLMNSICPILTQYLPQMAQTYAEAKHAPILQHPPSSVHRVVANPRLTPASLLTLLYGTLLPHGQPHGSVRAVRGDLDQLVHQSIIEGKAYILCTCKIVSTIVALSGITCKLDTSKGSMAIKNKEKKLLANKKKDENYFCNLK